MRQPRSKGDLSAFLVTHAKVTVVMVMLSGAAVLVYLLMTPDEPHRPTLMWMLSACIVLTPAALALPLERICEHPRAMWFFYAWNALMSGLVATAVWLDGGTLSPLLMIMAMPPVLGAMIYPPRAVAVLGAGTVALLALVALSTGTYEEGRALFAGSCLGLVTLAAWLNAYTHRSQYEGQRELAQQLAALADRDGLTECLNHRAFHERLKTAVETLEARPVSLLLLDIDHFKKVNDSHGHPVGDAVLARVARTLRTAARADDSVARLGGEEFALLLPNTGEEAARRIGERLRRAVGGLTDPVPVTVSVGIATAMEGHSVSPQALLQASDEAVYTAKRSGRDRVVVGNRPGGPTGIVPGVSAQLGRRIDQLLSSERVTAVFQPIVSMSDASIHAYESLARISGSNQGPDRWLELARQAGLQDELEHAMWEAALAHDATPNGELLFLNASPQALRSGHLLQCVDRLPVGTVIEVSEHEAIEDYTMLNRSLQPWRAAGMCVAVDDIGAGNADLRHVLHLAPDYLKLDRSLVTDVHRRASERALVESIVAFAERTGSTVIAEGIEEAEEAVVLAELGVTLGQGYYFARPAPPWAVVDAKASAPMLRSGHG